MFPTRRITTLGGDKFRDEYSLAFDGSDECIELSGTFNYNVHSISCWFKPTALAGAATLFDQRDTNNDGILLFLTDGDLNYQIDNVDGVYNFGRAATLGKWWHVVATNDGSVSTLYLNGVSVETADTSGETINLAGTYPPRIAGRSHTSADNYYTGNISEVAFYNVALSASQAKTLYNSREPYNHKEGIASANLKGWWRMGDGSLDSFNLIGDEVNPTIGPELVTNGSIGDGTGWTASNFAFADGVATTSTNGATLQQALSFTAGDIIKITAEIKNYSSGSCRWYTGSGDDTSRSFNSDGVHTHYLAGTNTKVLFYSDSFNGSIDNVSVRKVNGNSGAMINMEGVDFGGDTP